MKTSTTIILLMVTVCLGAWIFWRDGGTRDVNGHLLFDWSDQMEERLKRGEAGVDLDPAQVAGIDLKTSAGEFSLRRMADGGWQVTGGIKDLVDEGLVKELLNYCTKAQIRDIVKNGEVKEGKVSDASLGLDDSNAWRVTWLAADGSKLASIRIGKTAPLEDVAYVRMEGRESRSDIYIVKPDLRPLLARPPESFRDPRISRYPSEVLVKMVVRKGEGEVEFSRTFERAAPKPVKPASPPLNAISNPAKNVVEVEPTPWVISRPLPNAPADQAAVNEFAAMICGAKVEAWVPYSETANAGEKPVVEVTLTPAGAVARPITLQFFKDPADPAPAPVVKPGDPGAADTPPVFDPRSMAICRDAQRKASFKVSRQVMDGLCLAESPTIFRSTILASVDPGIVSTIRIEQSEGGSVEVVRVGGNWFWRPINGVKFEEAAPETVERLLTLLNSTQIVEFASDSLSDPAAFGLDKPFVSITIAVGAHRSLDQLNPIDNRNSQTLRIGLTSGTAGAVPVPDSQEKVRTARFYANFSKDPFVFRIGPELPGGIPRAYFKWRSLTLPGFLLQQVRTIKQTVGEDRPLDIQYNPFTLKWTGKRVGEDVAAQLNPVAVEALAVKAGSLQAVTWQDGGLGAAQAALELPAVRLDVTYASVEDPPDAPPRHKVTIELAPMASPTAIYCYGRITGKPEPFLIQRDALETLAGSVLKK